MNPTPPMTSENLRPDHPSLATTITMAWLAVLTPFVIAPAVLANGNTKNQPVSATEPISTTDPTAPKLSVPPLDHKEYPSSRPEWVGAKPTIDEWGTDLIVIVAGPNETKEACLEELRWMKRAAINTYVTGLIDDSPNADFYQLDDEAIDEALVTREYIGQVTAGGEVKFEHAVELQFTRTEKEMIRDAWKTVELGDRLGALGILLGLGLTLLICSGGLLGIVSRRVESPPSL